MRGKKGSVTRKFAALAAMFSIIRTALFLGADDIALAAASAAAQSESTVIGILDMEFDRKNSVFSGDPAITALLSLLRSETPDEHTEPPSGETEAPAKQPEPDKTQSDVVETTITGGNGYYCSDGIYIKNETDYNIDISQMLTSPLNFTLDLDKPQVLIIHTHGSESFDPSDGLSYEESDPWRTEDPEHNVIKLGDTLAEALEAQGISVLHDRELYDYPSYAGSYGRSETAIRSYLEKYPDIKVVFDLHRDALMGSDGTVYKTVAQVNGQKCAQVLIIAGSDFSGLEHPDWRENLKLALRLQSAMNEKYPSLARPLKISQYRYNQQLTDGSLIIEIGCNGNTLTEALAAVGYFADAAGAVLLDAPK